GFFCAHLPRRTKNAPLPIKGGGAQHLPCTVAGTKQDLGGLGFAFAKAYADIAAQALAKAGTAAVLCKVKPLICQ
ncbi:MAG: hypothetical protein KBG54_01955, partial [Oscillospiraceae bacterium]|nr:hypothetical protein [Oscillospiraceae bacterium]